MRGLDIKDAEMFFHMLTAVTEEEEVNIQTFVEGALRMRGVASSLDLYTLSFEVKIMHLHHRQFAKRWEAALAELRLDLANLRACHAAPTANLEGTPSEDFSCRNDPGVFRGPADFRSRNI